MGFLKKLFGGGSKDSKPSLDQRMPRGQMHTLDQSLVVEPFAKINYWNLPDGGKRVRVYFLLERAIEGAQTGVAIDGSGSMQGEFGKPQLRMVRKLTENEWGQLLELGLARHLGGGRVEFDPTNPQVLMMLMSFGALQETEPGPNIVEEQAREMTAYLSKFDADGGTTVIYWATGDGSQIEIVGDLTAEDCPTANFPGPQEFGNETHLLPAIQYFVNRFADVPWGIYVFITDGALNDLGAVKDYCKRLARDIDRGNRNDLKFVLIGVGDDVDIKQMEELDDLETGTNVDLWDHKIAKEMKQLAEIFAEVVSETVIIVTGDGMVRDANGEIVKDFRDTGLPALMWFDLPQGSNWFSLEVGGQTVLQPMAYGVELPAPMPPPVPSAPASKKEPETRACLECGEVFFNEEDICPRCGTSQEELMRQKTQQVQEPVAPPPPAPEPGPTPASAAPEIGELWLEPSSYDFGSVTSWKDDLPYFKFVLHNPRSVDWEGIAESTVPWLEVMPEKVSCPAGGSVKLTARLTQQGGELARREYVAPDAVFLEGGDEEIHLEVSLSTR